MFKKLSPEIINVSISKVSGCLPDCSPENCKPCAPGNICNPKKGFANTRLVGANIDQKCPPESCSPEYGCGPKDQPCGPSCGPKGD